MVFFIIVIALEFLALIGVMSVYTRLEQADKELRLARSQMFETTRTLSRTMRAGHQTLKVSQKVTPLLELLLPRWLKIGLGVARWVGKARPQHR